VRGRILSAREGLDTPFPRKIKGAAISQDDPDLLVADRFVLRDDNRIVFCRPDGSDPVVV
jgi:hypothetical protein